MNWITNRWNSYKYRFVPWIALNINNKTTVKINLKDKNMNPENLLNKLSSILKTFENYASLREDIELYSKIHNVNQKILLDKFGYSLVRKESLLEGAGKGVFIQQGQEKSLVQLKNDNNICTIGIKTII